MRGWWLIWLVWSGIASATPDQIISSGYYSQVVEREHWVIRSQAGMEKFQQATGVKIQQVRDWQNFEHQMLVAVFLGQRSTGGYALELLGVGHENGAITIQVKEKKPAADMMVTQALTSPFLILAMPLSEDRVVIEYR